MVGHSRSQVQLVGQKASDGETTQPKTIVTTSGVALTNTIPITNLGQRRQEVLKIYEANKRLVERLHSAKCHKDLKKQSSSPVTTPNKKPSNVTYRYINPIKQENNNGASFSTPRRSLPRIVHMIRHLSPKPFESTFLKRQYS